MEIGIETRATMIPERISLGIKDMLYLDHLIRNIDRHEKNFGVIIDAETDSIIRMAPIFDSGSCLNWKELDLSYKHDAKPFFDNKYEQLDLLTSQDVKNRHKIDFSELKKLIQNVYEKFNISEEKYNNAIACINQSYKELSEKCKNINLGGPEI